jgi:hypothetical protein
MDYALTKGLQETTLRKERNLRGVMVNQELHTDNQLEE